MMYMSKTQSLSPRSLKRRSNDPMVNLSKEDRLRNILRDRDRIKLSDLHDEYLGTAPRHAPSRNEIRNRIVKLGYKRLDPRKDVFVKR